MSKDEGDPIRTFTLRYLQSTYNQFEQTRRCMGSQSWEGFFLGLLKLVHEQADQVASLKAELAELQMELAANRRDE